MKKEGFIYGIFVNDKCVYIGKVYNQNKINKRKREHLHYLRNNYHHSEKLQKYFHDYGESSYDFRILKSYKSISEDELYEEESKFIELYNTYNTEYGCNKTKGGKGVKGLFQDEQSINKIRETKRKGFKEGIYQKTVGEINGMHILTEKEVKEIIALFYQGELTHSQIAKKYNVIRQTISLIYCGKRWSYLKEVQDWVEYKNKCILKKEIRTVRKQDIYEIKHLLAYTTMKFKEIANLYNVSEETIRRIKRGKRFKDVNINYPYSYYKEVM